ncbi:hypothetical protein ACR9GP_02865 [Enterobacter ludwigii]
MPTFTTDKSFNTRTSITIDKPLRLTFEAAKLHRGGEPSRSYKLHVEWASWSQAKRTALRNELDAAQEEAKDAGKKKLKDRAQVFFIGEQSADDHENFYVIDYRLICAIIGYISYPGIENNKDNELNRKS